MKTYALYIWCAYGISFVMLTSGLLVVLGGYVRMRRRIQNLAKNSA